MKPVWLEGKGTGNDQSADVQPPGHSAASSSEANALNEQSQAEFVEVFDAIEEETSIFPPAVLSTSYRELIELKTKLAMTEFQVQDSMAKLETANYRIGYLEARLETSQEQLRMLTDSRREQPWWQRWRQWFIASKQ